MNICWKRDGDGDGDGWLAFDEDDQAVLTDPLLHIGLRGPKNIRDKSWPAIRYCVFGYADYDYYCGDLPLDLSEEELKAAAIAMWRLSQ